MIVPSLPWRVIRIPKLRETEGRLGFLCGCGAVHIRGSRPHTPEMLRRIVWVRSRHLRRSRSLSPLKATILLVIITFALALVLYVVLAIEAK